MAAVITNDIQSVVYNHLVQLYQKFYMAAFEYLTMEHQALISYEAYRETIQMAQDGYIKDYYERIKRNAV